MNETGFGIELINYTKYLNCPDCKKKELYCDTHRTEVELILFGN